MKEYWSQKAKSMKPYQAGEQPKRERLIKLNTNENPYGPSPKVREALAHFDIDSLRLYPDPMSEDLKRTIATRCGLQPENVFCANGSDEALALCFQAFFDRERPVLVPDITYSFYQVWAEMYDKTLTSVPLNENFDLVMGDYENATGGILFPNPNAPTGRALPLEQIQKLVEHAKCIVIVDEAYVEFGAQSAQELVRKYENLVVVRTLSKSHGLAGLRLGYVLANQNLIAALETLKDSFNSYPVDRLAQTLGKAALEDEEYYGDVKDKVMATRQWFTSEMRNLGFRVLDSQANFVFASHPSCGAEKLMKALRERGIILRHFNQPRISEFLRITIGTDEQMQQLVKELEIILQS